MVVDKEIELLVNSAGIDDEKDRPLSPEQLRVLVKGGRHVHGQSA